MAGKVFVSYRRDDSAAYALTVAQYLESAFGKENVFLDVDRLRPGERFAEVLAARLRDCSVMLVVIGRTWLGSDPATGRRRIDEHDDWVRQEIIAGINRGIRIIPLLVDGAEFPDPAALPPMLRSLASLQYVTFTASGFRYEMAGLTNDIRPLLGSNTQQPRSRDQRILRISFKLSLLAGFLVTVYSLLTAHMSATWSASEELRINNVLDCAKKFSDEQLNAILDPSDGTMDLSRIGCSPVKFVARLYEVREGYPRWDPDTMYWERVRPAQCVVEGLISMVATFLLGLALVGCLRVLGWVFKT